MARRGRNFSAGRVDRMSAGVFASSETVVRAVIVHVVFGESAWA